MDHLFIRCNTAFNIWSKVASKIEWHNNHSSLNFLCKEMLENKQNSKKKIITFNLIATMLWTLWNERS